MNYLNKVTKFHKTFLVPVVDNPDIPDENRCQLRINLIQEELDELKQAIKDKNIVEIADALCDIQYVLSGTILEFGLGDKFDELFNEVQRSNMSKSCKSLKEAIMTISHYKKTQGIESYYKQVDNKWIVLRLSDNKVLKSVGYSPVNLQKILDKND